MQALKAASEKRDIGPRAEEDEWIPFFSFLEKLGDKSETAVTPCKCGAAAARAYLRHDLFHALISNGICSFPNTARRKSRSAAASARKSTGKRASSRRTTESLGGTPAAKRSERFTEG